MYDTDDYSISDLAELLSISRPTVYQTLWSAAGHTDKGGVMAGALKCEC